MGELLISTMLTRAKSLQVYFVQQFNQRENRMRFISSKNRNGTLSGVQSSFISLLYGTLLLCNVFCVQSVSVQAQVNQPETIIKNGIQSEVPKWPNNVAPFWDSRDAWGRAIHDFNPVHNTRYLRIAAERGDASADAVVQARAFAAAGKFDQAITEYKKAAETGWTPYDEWADLLEAKGDYAGAVRVYRELVYGSGLYQDAEGHVIPTPYDWKENGRSIRETLRVNPISRQLTPGRIDPAGAMRYALLLVKGKHYDEAVQVHTWCVKAAGSNSGDRYKMHPWLLTPFTAEAVRADPSLFTAQAWMIISLYDGTWRTDDYPSLIATLRLQKALAARPDYAPAWFLLAERYRDIGEFLEPGYLPLAVAAFQKAQFYDTDKSNRLLNLTDKSNKAEKETLHSRAGNALAEIQAGQKSTNPINY